MWGLNERGNKVLKSIDRPKQWTIQTYSTYNYIIMVYVNQKLSCWKSTNHPDACLHDVEIYCSTLPL
ncbi:unnamed protein product [Rhizophagus irregularis]|uniref:Uncharacterized protein n=1 Tax=Rhizophagus irregularis TaxID=588596 RepID=A0A915ZBM1_9GLOM|nr:unnamed protein product [Rhizophagus irregularis]